MFTLSCSHREFSTEPDFGTRHTSFLTHKTQFQLAHNRSKFVLTSHLFCLVTLLHCAFFCAFFRRPLAKSNGPDTPQAGCMSKAAGGVHVHQGTVEGMTGLMTIETNHNQMGRHLLEQEHVRHQSQQMLRPQQLQLQHSVTLTEQPATGSLLHGAQFTITDPSTLRSEPECSRSNQSDQKAKLQTDQNESQKIERRERPRARDKRSGQHPGIAGQRLTKWRRQQPQDRDQNGVGLPSPSPKGTAGRGDLLPETGVFMSSTMMGKRCTGDRKSTLYGPFTAP